MNWKKLNEAISSMTEDEVLTALNEEIDGKRRWTIVNRLHQRYCALRAKRERELFRQACAAGGLDSPRLPPAPTKLSQDPGDWPEVPDL
jgi:hypothetical protein